MKLSGITRDIIHIIGRNSNWEPEGINRALRSNVYTDKKDWTKFLNILLFALGVGFCVSGIIFFFAFNWDDMPKWFKIGLVEVFIIACVSAVLLTQSSPVIKNILLTGAALLVGALFGVYGQIYQTGADAYDFFLGWTVFITLWAFAVNFPPLWLVFLTLINITIWMYCRQVANWEALTLNNILFLVNSVFLIAYETLYWKKIIGNRAVWLSYIVALAAIILITWGTILIIFNRGSIMASWCCLFFCFVGFSGAIVYGLQSKRIFYIAMVSAAIVTIISCLIGKFINDVAMFFILGIFIVISITLIIKMIITLNKDWNGDK